MPRIDYSPAWLVPFFFPPSFVPNVTCFGSRLLLCLMTAPPNIPRLRMDVVVVLHWALLAVLGIRVLVIHMYV